jgi:acyl dehydratase
MGLLTDALRKRIGEVAVFTAPEPVGEASIRYFATAVDDLNPVYLDPVAARAAGLDGITAPPTMICETNQFIGQVPRREDGYLGHSWDLQVPNTRLVRGGNDYSFFRYTRPSDIITTTWHLSGIEERTSSRREPILIVHSEAVYRNQRDELIAKNLETLIYISLTTGGHE